MVSFIEKLQSEYMHDDANMAEEPSLNTQSCIKWLLVVWDFCFCSVCAAGPVHTKKFWGRLSATFEVGFVKFWRPNFFQNTIASAL